MRFVKRGAYIKFATEWQEKVQSSKEMRMKKNELSTLINQKKEEHQLTHIDINCLLIRQRISKKQAYLSTSCWHQNPDGPC
jgi:hypothetical protein